MNRFIGIIKKGSPEQLLNYWRKPNDNRNKEEDYFKGKERSNFLVKVMNTYADKTDSIMELGCNVGRNLKFLYDDGFSSLSGIEVNIHALKLMQKEYKVLYDNITIFNDSIENKIIDIADNTYNVVFTMAVLEHIHYRNEWIFNNIHKITKDYLITIEDERTFFSNRHFPRNYKKKFEVYGFVQIEEINCRKIKGLGKNFVCRVFKKEKDSSNPLFD